MKTSRLLGAPAPEILAGVNEAKDFGWHRYQRKAQSGNRLRCVAMLTYSYAMLHGTSSYSIRSYSIDIPLCVHDGPPWQTLFCGLSMLEF